MRQVYLAEILADKGVNVTVCDLCAACRYPGVSQASSMKEALETADVVAAPVPLSKGEEILRLLKPGSHFFAGKISQEFEAWAKEKHIKCFDYLKDETVAMKNTVAAAEGMIAEAICQSPRNLFRSSCLVLGYGRCGSTLVSCLKNFSCRVAVYERKPETAARASLVADSLVALAELPRVIQETAFIFNTVPALVLPRAMLGYVGKDALILDLASAPGGVDYEAAKEMGISARLLPGLPGRYAPASSAEILAEKILKEEMK